MTEAGIPGKAGPFSIGSGQARTHPPIPEMIVRPDLSVIIFRTSQSDFGGKAERTANPVQTTGIFGVKRGYCRNAVDGGNPFPRKEDGREYQTLMIGDM